MAHQHTLQIVAEAIGSLAQEITGIKNVETKPKFTAGRSLPALFVTYEGFRQLPLTFGPSWKMIYSFNLTLYLPLDGRNIETQWDSLLDLSNEIADTFRRSFTLESVAFKSEVLSGKPIIHIPKVPDGKPKWVGHRFNLEVTMEES